MSEDQDRTRPPKLKLEMAVCNRMDIPEDLYRRLQAHIEETGVTMQDIFDDAVDAVMAKYGRPPITRARVPFDTGQRSRARTKQR